MDLSQVSRTAILLLICRAVAAEKNKTEFDDPMAIVCLDRLISMAPEEDRRWIIGKKRLYEGMHAREAAAAAKRAKAFDTTANHFIAAHPNSTVINLACGFDTRFWRIDHAGCTYIDLDFPGVVALKKEILKDYPAYEMLAGSVLETGWIDRVAINGNTHFILLAEGLFMWLTKQDSVKVFKEIGERFLQSQLVLDMVPERYTKGIWKELFRLHARLEWGLDVAWEFGIKNPHEMEAYGKGFKVIGAAKGTVGPILTVSIHAET